MFKSLSSRRVKALGLGMAAAAVAVAALPMLGSAASADTAGNPATTTAQLGAQTSTIAPNVTTGGNLINLSSVSNNAVVLTTTAAAGTNYGYDARLCRGGVNITNNSAFAPSQGGNCMDPIISPNTYSGPVSPDAPKVTASYTMNVAAGTYTWNTISLGVQTFDCSAASPCSIWLREQVGASTYFSHFNLNFNPAPAIPATPAAPTASIAGNTATLNWTAPAAFPAITNYVVTPYISGVAQPTITTPTAATTLNVPGLTNFSSYTFSVIAVNSVGSSAASPQSAPPVVPTPAAPPAPNATAGNASAVVTFGAVSGATSYVVTPFNVTTSTAGAPVTTAGSPVTISGLTNGDFYTFSFHAVYPGPNNGSESAPSAQVKIGSKSIQQTIIVTRPQGNIDIAEVCANGYTGGTFGTPPLTTSYTGATANPGAGATPAYGTYPQTCDVYLGTGVLDATATYYNASGNILPVSVRDLRGTDTGWEVKTQMTNFTGVTPANTFRGDCLSFRPQYTELSNTPVYLQNVHVPTDGQGVTVAPTTGIAAAPFGGTCASAVPALSGQQVMSAQLAGGAGVAQLDGALAVKIPVATPIDTYAATLTFTVIGN